MPARKKDASARARTNRASTAATLSDSRTVPTTRRPALPQRRNEAGKIIAWSTATREWWKDLWASPMAVEYHSSDRHALFLLAALVDSFWNATTSTQRVQLAAEIRQQRAAFGLTPYDRRRLEWQIEASEEAKDRGTRRRTSGAPAPKAGSAAAKKAAAADPRRGLRAV